MTNKTGPATQQCQPTKPRPILTIAERNELLALIQDYATICHETGAAAARPDVTPDEYGQKLRAQTAAHTELLDWMFDRMQGGGV